MLWDVPFLLFLDFSPRGMVDDLLALGSVKQCSIPAQPFAQNSEGTRKATEKSWALDRPLQGETVVPK